MLAENFVLDNETRNDLLNSVVEKLQDSFYNEKINLIKMIQYDDMFINWYNGFTQLDIPVIVEDDIFSTIETSSPSGLVKTKNFGESFNSESFLNKMTFYLYIHPPASCLVSNCTLEIDLEKESLSKLEEGRSFVNLELETIESDSVKIILNPKKADCFIYGINVPTKTLRKQKIMPGFKIKWRFENTLENDTKFLNNSLNKEYIRMVNVINSSPLPLNEIWKIVRKIRIKALLEFSGFCEDVLSKSRIRQSIDELEEELGNREAPLLEEAADDLGMNPLVALR